jgi:pyocin large subunit-like protein
LFYIHPISLLLNLYHILRDNDVSFALTNQLKKCAGLTLAQKSILYRLADASQDGQTASIGVMKLADETGCDRTTAQRNLRQLEQMMVLIIMGTAGGAGHVLAYRIDLSILPKITRRPLHPTRLRRIEDDRPTALKEHMAQKEAAYLEGIRV